MRIKKITPKKAGVKKTATKEKGVSLLTPVLCNLPKPKTNIFALTHITQLKVHNRFPIAYDPD